MAYWYNARSLGSYYRLGLQLKFNLQVEIINVHGMRLISGRLRQCPLYSVTVSASEATVLWHFRNAYILF